MPPQGWPETEQTVKEELRAVPARLILYGKREQGNISSPLDRLGQLPLMPGAVSGNSGGNYFPPLRNQRFEQFDIEKIDDLNFIGTKATNFLCKE